MTRADLRKQLRIRNERLGKALSLLQEQGSIQRTAGRWRLSLSTEEAGSTDPPLVQQAFPFPLLGVAGNGTEVESDDPA